MELKKNSYNISLKILYPECYKCPFLEFIKENTVKCSYMIKDKCLIGGFNNESKSNK